MNCFFDPSHGQGMQNVMWAPQWGVVRQVMACTACAQRWATMQQQAAQGNNAGYAQQGYAQAPQQGYAAPQGRPGYAPQGQPGYAAPAQPGYAQPQRQGPGWGGVAAGVAAGAIGGALLNEMMDDDEPRVVNNYIDNSEYVEVDGDGDGDSWF
ncbi:hypothetical protein ACWD4B_20975 [Streptomyces sp. NPDC002536]